MVPMSFEKVWGNKTSTLHVVKGQRRMCELQLWGFDSEPRISRQPCDKVLGVGSISPKQGWYACDLQGFWLFFWKSQDSKNLETAWVSWMMIYMWASRTSMIPLRISSSCRWKPTVCRHQYRLIKIKPSQQISPDKYRLIKNSKQIY